MTYREARDKAAEDYVDIDFKAGWNVCAKWMLESDESPVKEALEALEFLTAEVGQHKQTLAEKGVKVLVSWESKAAQALAEFEKLKREMG